MKTFQVWLVLEETEDDSPQHQIETYQMTVVKTENEGRAVFEEAQNALEEVKNTLPDEWPDVPAECENRECAECRLHPDFRSKIDCPYID